LWAVCQWSFKNIRMSCLKFLADLSKKPKSFQRKRSFKGSSETKSSQTGSSHRTAESISW
jgi:hypothetical protein